MVWPALFNVCLTLIEQPIFSCKSSNRGALVESFVDALDGLATQSKAQKKLKFLQIETNLKSTLNQICCAPKQRRCCKEPVLDIEDGFIEEKEQDVSTHFLQPRKNQLIDLQDHLQMYRYVFHMLDFNSVN